VPPPLRSYYDPSLWDRLAPKLRDEAQDRVQRLVDGKWKTLEEAREIIGFLRAIDWIFSTADDLTRVQDAETEPSPGF
jgi:hypothetical protein